MTDSESDRVLKVRPSGEKTEREVSQLIKLFGYYRFNGVPTSSITVESLTESGFSVIQMPYLGVDLRYLAEALDLQQLGYQATHISDFRGFQAQHIDRLIATLKRSHIEFAHHYSLIHGDIFPIQTPNNILYNQHVDRLVLIDAEALTDYTSKSYFTFEENLLYVQEWFHRNLLLEIAG